MISELPCVYININIYYILYICNGIIGTGLYHITENVSAVSTFLE